MQRASGQPAKVPSSDASYGYVFFSPSQPGLLRTSCVVGRCCKSGPKSNRKNITHRNLHCMERADWENHPHLGRGYIYLQGKLTLYSPQNAHGRCLSNDKCSISLAIFIFVSIFGKIGSEEMKDLL